MKTLLGLLLAVLALPALGADSTIHGLPTRTSPSTNDMLVIDYQSGAAWYNGKIPLASLQQFMSGTPTNYTQTIYTTNAYIVYLTNAYQETTALYVTNAWLNYITNNYLVTTNLYATNEYVNYFTNNYSYITNLWVTNEYVNYFTNNYAYITNLYATNSYIEFLTNSYLLATNLFVTNAYIEYLTNNYLITTNLFATNTYLEYLTNNYQITTNLYVTNAYVEYFTNDYAWATNINVSNAYITNITAKNVYVTEVINANNSVITNNQFFVTNAWAGPTNDIDLTKADVYYDTWTPCSITGVINKSNAMSSSVLLTITNKAATNITLYFPIPWIPERTSSVTISNASQGMLSLRYHPMAGTNAVYRQF